MISVFGCEFRSPSIAVHSLFDSSSLWTFLGALVCTHQCSKCWARQGASQEFLPTEFLFPVRWTFIGVCMRRRWITDCIHAGWSTFKMLYVLYIENGRHFIFSHSCTYPDYNRKLKGTWAGEAKGQNCWSFQSIYHSFTPHLAQRLSLVGSLSSGWPRNIVHKCMRKRWEGGTDRIFF